MEGITRADKFEPKQVNYSDIKKTPSGGKSIHLNNGNNQGILLQTPSMKCPFGVKSFDDESQKFTLELSFGQNLEDNKVNKNFHDALEQLDDKLLDDGVKNSMAWFGKKNINKDVLKALFSPQLRLSRDKETGEPDGKYPPTFRIKIPFYEGQWQCKVFDENKQKVDQDLREVLVPGCEVKALIKCTGMWFVSGKYGCTWKAMQLVVKRPKNFVEYAFIDSDAEVEDDKDELIESSDED